MQTMTIKGERVAVIEAGEIVTLRWGGIVSSGPAEVIEVAEACERTCVLEGEGLIVRRDNREIMVAPESVVGAEGCARFVQVG